MEVYRQKEMQNELYEKQDHMCNLWLEQKLTPKKTAVIMSMLEQMVETKACKVTRGLSECNKCRLCADQKERVGHLLAGCKVLANSEYLARHNRALMILARGGGGSSINNKRGCAILTPKVVPKNPGTYLKLRPKNQGT